MSMRVIDGRQVIDPSALLPGQEDLLRENKIRFIAYVSMSGQRTVMLFCNRMHIDGFRELQSPDLLEDMRLNHRTESADFLGAGYVRDGQHLEINSTSIAEVFGRDGPQDHAERMHLLQDICAVLRPFFPDIQVL